MISKKRFSILFTSLIILSTGFLSACSGSKNDTRFYALSAVAPSPAHTNSPLRLGIGPVEIPRLLKRPQIVTRTNNTQIELAEKHQWGGTIKEEITQTLSDNLSSLLNTKKIERYPWKFSFKPNYQVRVDIEQFDGQPGKSVTLKARWRILANKQEIKVEHSIIQTPTKGADFTAYVNAQSQALYTLSQKIAAAIK